MELVTQKKRLVEYGAFRMGDPGSATITVHFRFTSKWITPLSPVNPENFIILFILLMVTFVEVSVLLEYILYFLPLMWREDMTAFRNVITAEVCILSNYVVTQIPFIWKKNTGIITQVIFFPGMVLSVLSKRGEI